LRGVKIKKNHSLTLGKVGKRVRKKLERLFLEKGFFFGPGREPGNVAKGEGRKKGKGILNGLGDHEKKISEKK